MNEHEPDAKTRRDLSTVKNPKVAYEPRDVDLRRLVIFSLSLLVAAFIIYLALAGMFSYFVGREARLKPPPPLLVRTGQQHLPPEPRLQGVPGHTIHPLDELKQVQSSETAVLNSYGWVDQPRGIVRIPIEQAMRLLVERGLPSRQGASEREAPNQGREAGLKLHAQD